MLLNASSFHAGSIAPAFSDYKVHPVYRLQFSEIRLFDQTPYHIWLGGSLLCGGFVEMVIAVAVRLPVQNGFEVGN